LADKNLLRYFYIKGFSTIGRYIYATAALFDNGPKIVGSGGTQLPMVIR
jgi:hypothetical protein